MTQIGESVSVIPPSGKQKCVFCNEDHQKEKAAAKASFPRDMTKLKNEGRQYSRENYSSYYPDENKPPLVKWQKIITITGGYKAAAHHCIALKSVGNHEISGELKEADYNPNRGSNCCWLPYSSPQFSRARAYNKALQKHRGGHTNAYFTKVDKHIQKVSDLIEDNFCFEDKVVSKEILLEYMKIQEKMIWQGLASHVMEDYHLYNKSYLNPDAQWGAYDYEKGKTKNDVTKENTPLADDIQAESESENDSES